MQVLGLFPTPVAIFKLNRDLTKKELNFVDECEKNLVTNIGNFFSNNKNVLDNSKLKDIKKFILEKVQIYFNEIIKPQGNVKPFISLSWINFNYKNNFHHKHTHNNSVLSGVFYIDTIQDDKIYFYKEMHKIIDFAPKEFNTFNSDSWWITTEKNSLILFPSHLVHDVPITNRDSPRISLSFNIFVRGNIGDSTQLGSVNL